MDINEAKKLFEEIAEKNKDRHANSLLGIEGEKAHGYRVLSWVEKLEPEAPTELRIAGLFHDIDRIANPEHATGSKFDRTSQEYLDHKKAHAKRSADVTKSALLGAGAEPSFADRVSFLISHHDDTESEVMACRDNDLDVLVAADSLSYFDSLAENTLKNFGEKQLRGKVQFMLSKMPVRFRKILKDMRLENPLINQIKEETLANL